jgi:ribosomal protein L35AE/L33A
VQCAQELLHWRALIRLRNLQSRARAEAYVGRDCYRGFTYPRNRGNTIKGFINGSYDVA